MKTRSPRPLDEGDIDQSQVSGWPTAFSPRRYPRRRAFYECAQLQSSPPAFAGAGSTLSRGQAPRFRGGRLHAFSVFVATCGLCDSLQRQGLSLGRRGARPPRRRGGLKLQPHAQGIGGVCLFTACRWIGFVIEVGAQGRVYAIAEGKTNSGT